MTHPKSQHRPSKVWWLLALVLLLLFIVLQLPAAWVLARFAPQNPYISDASGNVWSGQADWHVENLHGTLHWRWRPLQLLRLRVAADLEVRSGNSSLNGQVALGKTTWQIEQLQGTVSAQTLRVALPWQWPESPLQLDQVGLSFDQGSGWRIAEGELKWGGGVLGYPFEGRIERATLPPLIGRFNLDRERLHVGLTDNAKSRMGDFYLSADQMLDVQLTQRLLQTVAGYRGQAALDAAVITTRQPLSTLGSF